MSRKLIMLTFLTVLFVVSLFVGGETKSASAERVGSSAFSEETVDVYFFYGQGCPHCAKVEPFLAEMEQKYPLHLHKFDIYSNRSCISLFDSYSNKYGLSLKRRGVPTVFLADTYFVGDTPILNGFEEAVKKAFKGSPSVAQTLPVEHPEGSAQEAASAVTGPSIFTIAVTALVDSISPCSMATMVFLVGARVLVANRRKRMLRVGLAFCLSVFIAYFLFGLGLFTFIQANGLSGIFSLLVGLLAVLVGMFYLKDVFWYGKGGFVMEVPRSLKPVLMKLLKGVTSPLGAFAMGFVVVCFELPCTGGPYLFILGQLADTATRLQAIPTLLYYNFMFVLPLIMISLLLYSGLSSVSKVREWTEKKKRWIRFTGGLAMITLGFLKIPMSPVMQLMQSFLRCFRLFGPPLLAFVFLYLAISISKRKNTMNCLRGGLLFSVLLAIAFIVPSPVYVSGTRESVKPYFIYFRVKPGKAEIDTISSLGGSIRITYDTMPVLSANLPTHAVESLKRCPNVVEIEEVGFYRLLETVPWGMDKIRADEVWPLGINGSDVRVAVIDSGIDTDHPDLQANIAWCVDAGNFGSCEDTYGHGTYTAGIVAAIDNEIGVIGVAPEANIYAIKACTGPGCDEDAIVEGIELARKGPDGNVSTKSDNAQIISMSLGGPFSFKKAFVVQMQAAYNEGIVLVAASGNNLLYCPLKCFAGQCEMPNGDPGCYCEEPYDPTCVPLRWPRCYYEISYPAKYLEVIAVGATDVNDVLMGGNTECEVYPGSQWGLELELVAPGVDVNSTWKEGGYHVGTGTSAACPHVSGTIALMLELNPSLTPDDARAILCETAVDLGDSGRDYKFGCGRVDAYEAVTSLMCTSNEECDDSNECTIDECINQTCHYTNVADNTPCTGGVCCSGTCVAPTCTVDADCNDSEPCTTDSCQNPGLCNAYCENTWPPCGPADGCCGPSCTYPQDPDCPHVCGDGYCAGSSSGEDCNTCPEDCISGGGTCEACWKGVCDGVCNPKKEDQTCADCNPSYCCGNYVCEGNENATNCPVDCPVEEYCGNGYCAGQALGEDCYTCPEDCPGKTGGKPSDRYCCGNEVCEPAGEDSTNCPVDCPGAAASSVAECGCSSEIPPREPALPLVWGMEIMPVIVAIYIRRRQKASKILRAMGLNPFGY